MQESKTTEMFVFVLLLPLLILQCCKRIEKYIIFRKSLIPRQFSFVLRKEEGQRTCLDDVKSSGQE